MELRGSLARRIARLEQRLGGIEMPKFIVMDRPIEAERRAHLAPGERIVIDWYSDVCGWVSARERITTDPEDQGQQGEPTFILPRSMKRKS